MLEILNPRSQSQNRRETQAREKEGERRTSFLQLTLETNQCLLDGR
jgi:hypothetical protein